MSGPWELCGGEGGGVAGHHRDGQAAGAEDRAHHGVEGPSSSVPRNLIDAMAPSDISRIRIVMHALPPAPMRHALLALPGPDLA